MSRAGKSLARYLGPDYLFGVARQLLMADYCWLPTIFKLLQAAESMGHEEAAWLQMMLNSNAYFLSTVNTKDNEKITKRLEELFMTEDSPRSLAYAAWFSGSDTVEFVERAQQSSAAGDGFGHYVTSWIHRWHHDDRPSNSNDAEVEYRRKAVLQNVPEAYHDEANRRKIDESFTYNDKINLHLKAANSGHRDSMNVLIDAFKLTNESLGCNRLDGIKWKARRTMSSITTHLSVLTLFDDIPRHMIYFHKSMTEEMVEIAFTIGHEFDGYQDFFPPLKAETEHLEEIMMVYRSIINLVRYTSLFTLVVFKRLLGKDVARLIARLVYASRLECFAWYRS